MSTSPPALRPLGSTELLDSAVRAVWTQRSAVFPIAVPVAVGVTALGSWLQYTTLHDRSATLLSAGATLLVRLLAGVLLGGLLAPAFSRGIVGERLGAGQCLRAVGRRWLPLLVLAVVVTVAEGIGLVLLVVGGIWLWGLWAVAAPAMTVEGLGPMRAVRRSSALVSGDFGRVWGLRALGWLVTYVIALLATAPFQIIGLFAARVHSFGRPGQDIGRPGLYVAILSIGTVLALVVVGPIAAAIDTLIYTDLRMRREGMDIVMSLPPRTAAAYVPAATAQPDGPYRPAAPW